MTRPIRLLIVDDSEDDAVLMVRALEREGYSPTWRRVEEAAAMRQALTQSWDVIICDWSMPRFSVPAALAITQQLGLDVPLIIVSGVVGEETAVEAMRAGAQDYVLKGRFARLGPAIERELAEKARRLQASEQLRKAEEQLRQTQRLEAVGRLAGGVAHDVNNLMAVVLANAGMLASHPDAPEARELLDDIAAAGSRAADLAKQLLVFSRTQALLREALPLSPVVGATTRMLRPIVGDGITVSTQLSDDAGYVEAHRGQIEQVVMNLVVNGRDAMPTGGSLRVATAGVSVRESAAQAMGVRSGPYARLSVEDTGVGMDEGVRARIFDPFFTTKSASGGSGLGLSTVYGIVRHAGGAIDVASAPGRGSRFDIYLPQVDAAPVAADVDPLVALPRGGETILVIEPQEAFRLVLMNALTELGYAVIECHDPNDAVERAQDSAKPVQLALIDVDIPGRVAEPPTNVIDRLRTVRPGIRALVLASAGSPGRVPGALIKPFTPQALARGVRDVLDGARR